MKISQIATADDPAHDLLHFQRVVQNAKYLCEKEAANEAIVVPAAWLHDLIIVPKSSALRRQASRLSAQEASLFLQSIEYPSQLIPQIAHAIEAHSFSAGIEAKTLEAQVVQDADRLDGLGAIGIARCFVTAGLMKRPLYAAEDPFCDSRQPDDGLFTIDHFYKKLFRTAETLQTEAGKIEGRRRVDFMKEFLGSLGKEIQFDILAVASSASF